MAFTARLLACVVVLPVIFGLLVFLTFIAGLCWWLTDESDGR